MHVTDSEHRFPALHKAIGKMAPPAASPWEILLKGFDGQITPLGMEFAQAQDEVEKEPVTSEPVRAEPETPVRGALPASTPLDWVAAKPADSAERRTQRLARVRAERELAIERERMVRTVRELRLAKAESEIRKSESAVRAMEERLQSGHTGRLGWMEAQVVKWRSAMLSRAS